LQQRQCSRTPRAQHKRARSPQLGDDHAAARSTWGGRLRRDRRATRGPLEPRLGRAARRSFRHRATTRHRRWWWGAAPGGSNRKQQELRAKTPPKHWQRHLTSSRVAWPGMRRPAQSLRQVVAEWQLEERLIFSIDKGPLLQPQLDHFNLDSPSSPRPLFWQHVARHKPCAFTEDHHFDSGHVRSHEAGRVDLQHVAKPREQRSDPSWRVVLRGQGDPHSRAQISSHTGVRWASSSRSSVICTSSCMIVGRAMAASRAACVWKRSPQPRFHQLDRVVGKGMEQCERDGLQVVEEAMWRIQPHHGEPTRSLEVPGWHVYLHVFRAHRGHRD
jgi:hypothetical protein